MAVYTVDSEQLQLAVTSTQASIGRVQAEVAALLGNLTALEGSWTGEAATAFQGLVQQWRATQTQVESSISAINAALGSASASYGTVEGDVRRLFST
ncbi:WXG100 family type VII secretion target [Pseudoclavibacter helvolus]|uniref:WXG100 family type VII secretion target n=1 Tax=Pseudoclavibacter helvolus TaxID=255205 RepID=UPI003C72C2BA